jgi:hypothetical protein
MNQHRSGLILSRRFSLWELSLSSLFGVRLLSFAGVVGMLGNAVKN